MTSLKLKLLAIDEEIARLELEFLLKVNDSRDCKFLAALSKQQVSDIDTFKQDYLDPAMKPIKTATLAKTDFKELKFIKASLTESYKTVRTKNPNQCWKVEMNGKKIFIMFISAEEAKYKIISEAEVAQQKYYEVYDTFITVWNTRGKKGKGELNDQREKITNSIKQELGL